MLEGGGSSTVFAAVLKQNGKSKTVSVRCGDLHFRGIIKKLSPWGRLELLPVKHLFFWCLSGGQQALGMPEARRRCSPQRRLLSQLLLGAFR